VEREDNAFNLQDAQARNQIQDELKKLTALSGEVSTSRIKRASQLGAEDTDTCTESQSSFQLAGQAHKMDRVGLEGLDQSELIG